MSDRGDAASATPRALRRCFNQADLRRLAALRLPRGMLEFIDRGTEDEVALVNNAAALGRIRLVERVLTFIGCPYVRRLGPGNVLGGGRCKRSAWRS